MSATCTHCGTQMRGVNDVPLHECPASPAIAAPRPASVMYAWRSAAASAARARSLSRKAVALRYRLIP